MASRKIIWSHKAEVKLYEILKFYYQRNRSKIYPQKLYKKINAKILLLRNQPLIGIKTDETNIRALISENYYIFYEITDIQIIIHTIWDSRQNPDNLKIK